MKKIFTLLTALTCSLSLFALPSQNLLSISSNTKYRVSIIIDNRNYQDARSGSNDFFIRDLRPGYHSISIYKAKNYGYNSKYSSRRELVYSGNVFVKNGFHVDITINRFGKAFIDETCMDKRYFDDDDDIDANDDSQYGMSDDVFSSFKQTISNAQFESTKLTLAKQTISDHYFTSSQVKELAEMFSFDNSRLDIAKAAYRNTVDKSNYFIVNDALQFSSSKEELAKFLATSR
jgi:hypothetical protein